MIHASLMWRDKAETWMFAQDLGGETLVALIHHEIHTCYDGDRAFWHGWRCGSGRCPARQLRTDGWRRYVFARSPVHQGVLS